MSIFRLYVEKKAEFSVEAIHILHDLKLALSPAGLKGVRILNRYDIEGVSPASLESISHHVLSEPSVDQIYFDLPPTDGYRVLAVEYLPGQYDQRADSAAQCISLITTQPTPLVNNARIYYLEGEISEDEFDRIKTYLINPVESREASLATVTSLHMPQQQPPDVAIMHGFNALDQTALQHMIEADGLAMSLDDLMFCQAYFRDQEKRDPTITELRVIDTYWSDHCRHTTFLTPIQEVTIQDSMIWETYQQYLTARNAVYGAETSRPVTLMDLATIAAKQLKQQGFLNTLDESEEINACSVRIKAQTSQGEQDYLLMFKNETHNHPTEIEPFGGAATCLGGAIRDPLAGRAYVYQAMRVTGCANPLTDTKDTMQGKLPQRKITVGAANGYSSYGNQIGVATGHVSEIYHPGYAAKRMELGAVIAAVPAHHVIRERPVPGDVVVLLGGKTGRDGCGGATGSSKSHTADSVVQCGSEVQKGNPLEQRKLQRLFRKPEMARLIRRGNDFGAGGACVAMGELADGVCINLDAMPQKYDGLNGTELAISESQERMACVVKQQDADTLIAYADAENACATVVAKVTQAPRLRMLWRGDEIVNISRDFLNTNGVKKAVSVDIAAQAVKPIHRHENNRQGWAAHLGSLALCSQRGLVQRFDATVGAGTILAPYGGERQLTPTQAMVAKIPVVSGETTTASVMAWGYNPWIAEQSPYFGGMYAVIESVAKLISVGGDHRQAFLSLQEYFGRVGQDPLRWGDPFAALLGAYQAQISLCIAAIGGKDSMSGSFEQLDVPPTLVSFAVGTADTNKVISPEFKAAGSPVALVVPSYHQNGMPDFAHLRETFQMVRHLIATEQVSACFALTSGGVSQAVFQMALGNKIGMKFAKPLSEALMFDGVYGGFLLELAGSYSVAQNLNIIGVTTSKYVAVLSNTEVVDLNEVERAYESKLEPVFRCNIKNAQHKIRNITYQGPQGATKSSLSFARPRVLLPVFPGTNCEYESERVFERAGAQVETLVIRNRTAGQIQQSIKEFDRLLHRSQILMLPGGFSGGDEPDGSAKFIAALLRNPRITDGVHRLLQAHDGLILGICNGFQALLKLGLVPYGEIVPVQSQSPTLTFNTIARHQSKMVYTRICSTKSPWLSKVRTGDVHTVAISHGEGRFAAPDTLLKKLELNGQIATQYVDLLGDATGDVAFNPGNSVYAIEGLTSPDGRVFGKMAHSERIGEDICKNVPGDKNQYLFESAVAYFST